MDPDRRAERCLIGLLRTRDRLDAVITNATAGRRAGVSCRDGRSDR
ncbi:hypothetical protein [Actinoplanes sp. NPDC051851]